MACACLTRGNVVDSPLAIWSLRRSWLAVLCLACMLPASAHAQVLDLGQMVVDQFSDLTGLDWDAPGPMSVKQLAHAIDHLDTKLNRYGRVAVKAPDVFGQN